LFSLGLMPAVDTAPLQTKSLSDNTAHFIASLFITALFVAVAFWVGRGSIAFALFAVVLMYFGRRVGWLLSRASLYLHPLPVIIVECIIWGVFVAYLVHLLISWQQPHWLIRWVLGYALGAYVAVPNYGLLVESSIPDHAQPRHLTISNLPLLAYVASSILFAYTQ
jgi:hypothetical protein